jgi:DNA-binding GntR family transcriptional regulator
MLEAKGLVQTTPFRGAVVVDLTGEEVEQLYFLRAKLEGIAADLVIKNISRKEIQRLNRLHRDLEKHLRERTDQMIEKDNEFHRALFEPSGNSYLNNMIDYLSTKAHIVQFNSWSLPNRIEQSIDEHRAMIEALRQRDEKAFERLVANHLFFSKNSYLAQSRGVKATGESKKSKASGMGR